jgi:ferredoxin--NADP+ reductase
MKGTERNLHTLSHFAATAPSGKPRRIALRFLRSPVALEGDGKVERIVLGKNRLVPGSGGDVKAEATGESESIPVGLVFRSVGYLGTGLPELPIDAKRGIIPNSGGRMIRDGAPAPGEYVVGWIKRGPSGVIGTNKPDAVESADLLLADLAAGALAAPAVTEPSVDQLLESRGVRVVSWADWQKLDAMEKSRGAAVGRPRLKFSRVEDMLAALAE